MLAAAQAAKKTEREAPVLNYELAAAQAAKKITPSALHGS